MFAAKDYSHNRPFTLAAERPNIPYMGVVEDEIRNHFEGTYRLAAGYFRSPHFIDHFTNAIRIGPEQAMALVEGHLEEAGDLFAVQFAGTIGPVVSGAARISLDWGVVEKAAPALATQPRSRRFRKPPYKGPKLNIPRSSGYPYRADPYHVEAARELSLNLVTNVNQTQRGKIRAIVTQSITRGITPDVTGGRIANVVGLFPRWQQAVDNLYMNMLESGTPIHIAERRAQEYWNQLIEKRGMMIARTELMRAMNTGRLEGWKESRDIDNRKSTKVWVAAPDACPDCADMNGTEVKGILKRFDTYLGPVTMPPLHPHCRCTVNIVPA